MEAYVLHHGLDGSLLITSEDANTSDSQVLLIRLLINVESNVFT